MEEEGRGLDMGSREEIHRLRQNQIHRDDYNRI